MNVDLSIAMNTIHQMVSGAIALLPNLIIAAIVFTLMWLLARTVGRAVTSLMNRTGKPPSVGLVLGRLARWALLLLGAMVSLTIVVPSLNASAVLGALGVGGVAIGFAFKDIFQNLLAGLLLLVTRPFQIGDVILSGGHEGTVEDIQVRATLVRGADGRLIVIPNSDLYTNRVVVSTHHHNRRVALSVGIGYDADIERAKALILAAVSPLPQLVREPAPSVVTTALGDSSVELTVRFWVGPVGSGDPVAATDAVVIAAKQALDAAGIDIPFPIRTLHLPAARPLLEAVAAA